MIDRCHSDGLSLFLIVAAVAIALGMIVYSLVVLWKSSIYTRQEKRAITFMIIFLSLVGCIIFYSMNSERKKLTKQ